MPKVITAAPCVSRQASRRYRPLWLLLCAAALACGCAEQTPEPQAPVVVSTEGPVAKSKSKPAAPEAAAGTSAEKVRRAIEKVEVKILGVLGDGATTADVLTPSEVPVGLLDDAARGGLGAPSGGARGLRGGSGGGAAGSGAATGGGVPGTSGGGSLTAVGRSAAGGSGGGQGGGNVLGSTQLTVLGAVSKQDVRKVLLRHLRRIRRCYERELTRNPDAGGKLVVWFVIEPNGRVNGTAVSSSDTNSSDLDSCVLRIIRTMRFPKPKGGGIAMVNYPFIFKADP